MGVSPLPHAAGPRLGEAQRLRRDLRAPWFWTSFPRPNLLRLTEARSVNMLAEVLS